MTTATALTVQDSSATDFDVLIVGAGISGIGAAYHLATRLPGRSFAILEGREAVGGTWDLFRFPGIRSDSDLFTFGFGFKPWTADKSIAGGDLILSYLRETVAENELERHIRFGHRVTAARWSSDEARWTVTAQRSGDGEVVELTCRFLLTGTGYFDYEEGFTPHFDGIEDFAGLVVHPQFWPEDLDYAGKRVVIIGSGATAVTILPAMTGSAAHVTMLQRSPSYMLSLPAEDPIAILLQRVLGPERAHRITRRKNIFIQRGIYKASRRHPRLVRRALMADVRRRLPKGFDVGTHFNPTYDPWDQRMCLVPDGDLFEAISSGGASVVTDRIDRFTRDGVELASGKLLEADIVVTATGLNMLALGGIALTVDGAEVELPEATVYKSMMLRDVPNFAFVIGYTNASWTLKVDLVCHHLCRLLAYMDAHDADMVVPACDDAGMGRLPLFGLTSGYVQRGIQRFPHAGTREPWTAEMAYERDVERLRDGVVDGPELHFRTPVQPPRPAERAVGLRPWAATESATT
jgi:cation diffusion facilitator CzcD-associated flavoprotein CzcO